MNWAQELSKHRKKYFKKSITANANAGQVDIASVSLGSLVVKSVIVRANSLITTDWTSATVTSGVSGTPTRVTHLTSSTLKRTNVANPSEQVSWQGAVKLNDTDKIVINLTGTGATTTDFDILIEYDIAESNSELI